MDTQSVETECRRALKLPVRLIPDGTHRYRVSLPLRFDDGDHFVIVLVKDDDRWSFTDEAHTLMHLADELDNQDETIENTVLSKKPPCSTAHGRDPNGRPLTLRTLLAQPPEAFAAYGIDTHGYNLFRTAIELGRRYIRSEIHRGRTLSNPEDAALAITERLRDQRRETFNCLYLDNRHTIIAFEEFAKGTVTETRIYVRELVRRALELDASALIIAHNHPSGSTEVSPGDRDITKKIDEALKLVEIRLLDHLIVADGRCVSFHKLGLLPRP